MKTISLGIAVVGGAIMAGMGAIAEGLPDTHRYNALDDFGMCISGLAMFLLTIEFIRTLFKPQQ